MAKVVECRKVDPTSACNYVARGNEEEVIRKTVQHVKIHGIYNHSPNIWDRVKAQVREG